MCINMNCSQEIPGICGVCLAVNAKIYNIKNSRLQALYNKIVCAECEFDFALDIGVLFGACYICYAQLLKIHKFSELAQSSGKRLQYLKDHVMMSTEIPDFYHINTQHNLSITVIPPIAIQSNSNVTEINVINPIIFKKEHIEHEHRTTDNYYEKSNCCVTKHPKLTMPQANSQTKSRENQMQTKTLIVTERIREGSARSNPISDEYVASNPVSVKEEYFEYEYNIANDCELLNNCDIEHPTLTIPPGSISQTQSPTQTKTLDGTQIKREDCALSKPIAEINAVNNLGSFKEEYIENKRNTTDDCEMSNNCDIEYPTLTMSSDPTNLIQSPMQTETLAGIKKMREGCALSKLIEQQKEKTEVNESENVKALTNTPITRNVHIANKRKKYLAENNGDRKETKIKEIIQMLIKIHKQSNNTKKLPATREKEPTWCNRSQELLIQLIRLAGSERAGTMLLADRVFPLFPQGFMRSPSLSSLLRMAGYKKIKNPDCNEHEDVVLDYKRIAEKSIKHRLTSCQSIKIMPSSALREKQGPKLTVETSPALLMPSSKITKLSLNHVLNIESKKDTKGFVPVNIILRNKIVKSKGKKPTNIYPILRLATAVIETVNEAKLQKPNILRKQKDIPKLSQQDKISTDNDLQVTSVLSLVPKDTDKINKYQEQNEVRINKNRIRRISNNKEGQKLAHAQLSEAKIEPSASAVSNDSGNELKAMLNKFSKFKEKLDSQNQDLESSSDVEIIEND